MHWHRVRDGAFTQLRRPLAATRRAVTALLCLGLLLVGCGSGEPGIEPLASGATVLAFGDSLTFGTGAKPEESYPVVLTALTGLTVVNAGVPGEVSVDGLRRLQATLERESPKLVVLCHGGNDILRRLDVKATEQNLRAMVAQIRDYGASVVMLGVPAPSLLLGAAPFYEQVAEDLGVPYDGDIIGELLRDNRLKSDTVHPNAQGYDLLAQAVVSLLQKAGALRP
ncbi:MAG: arylesterase [Gammaproteobacteria bacterium]|nr:arylesterase [Gammaproteobacteria bacterium]